MDHLIITAIEVYESIIYSIDPNQEKEYKKQSSLWFQTPFIPFSQKV